jgi:hypothetical protein
VCVCESENTFNIYRTSDVGRGTDKRVHADGVEERIEEQAAPCKLEADLRG